MTSCCFNFQVPDYQKMTVFQVCWNSWESHLNFVHEEEASSEHLKKGWAEEQDYIYV